MKTIDRIPFVSSAEKLEKKIFISQSIIDLNTTNTYYSRSI